MIYENLFFRSADLCKLWLRTYHGPLSIRGINLFSILVLHQVLDWTLSGYRCILVFDVFFLSEIDVIRLGLAFLFGPPRLASSSFGALCNLVYFASNLNISITLIHALRYIKKNKSRYFSYIPNIFDIENPVKVLTVKTF